MNLHGRVPVIRTLNSSYATQFTCLGCDWCPMAAVFRVFQGPGVLEGPSNQILNPTQAPSHMFGGVWAVGSWRPESAGLVLKGLLSVQDLGFWGSEQSCWHVRGLVRNFGIGWARVDGASDANWKQTFLRRHNSEHLLNELSSLPALTLLIVASEVQRS